MLIRVFLRFDTCSPYFFSHILVCAHIYKTENIKTRINLSTYDQYPTALPYVVPSTPPTHSLLQKVSKYKRSGLSQQEIMITEELL